MNTIRRYLILLLLILPTSGFAQVTFFDFTVFEPLPSVDMGAMITVNGLRNTQRLFLVTISPTGIPVKLEGMIRWRDVTEGASYKQMYHFITREFPSKNFTNADIGNTDVRLDVHEFNSEVSDELINKRGKPVGDFEFTATLLNADGSVYPGFAPITRILSFPNPAQTLSISLPTADSQLDMYNVLAQWNQITGATDYQIKVGVRTNTSQSFEEALNSGTLLADNVSVGNTTSVNLFTSLQRQWAPGQEIVFQVVAISPGMGGGNKFYSQIVNFTLNSNDTSSTRTTSSRTKYSLTDIRNMFAGFSNSEIISFLSNNVEISDILDGQGNSISLADLQRILDELKKDPNTKLNVTTIFRNEGTK